MVFFTTPELLEIGGLPLVTPYDKPTRLEALRYYRRVVETATVSRSSFDRARNSPPTDGCRGHPSGGDARPTSSACSGVRGQRARRGAGHRLLRSSRTTLGIPGEDLPHVSHYYTEAHPYYRQRVVVVGGKNSAAETALELFRAGAHVTLVHRQATLGDSIKYWVRPDIDNRIKEGSIPARFDTRWSRSPPRGDIEHVGRGTGTRRSLPADRVFLLTGYHADFALLEACGISIESEQRRAAYRPVDARKQHPERVLAAGCWRGRIPRQSSSKTDGSMASDW